MTFKMPKPRVTPNVAPTMIGALLHEFDSFDEARAAKEYPWAERFVMGYPLAPWQRGFKWTPKQSQRFITSAWTGVYLGNYILTSPEMRNENGNFRGVEYLPLCNMVIEGQQRLKSIELYVTDQLAVPDASGRLTLWSEVDEIDRRRFNRTLFSRGELRTHDEAELRGIYDLLNFGGVAHEEHERAVRPVERASTNLGPGVFEYSPERAQDPLVFRRTSKP